MLRSTTVKFQRILYQKSLLSLSAYSTVHAEPADLSADVDPKLHTSTITPRGKPKVPKRKPLVKNFMVGLIDKELIAFPEVIPRDDYSKLKEDTWHITNYFKDSLESKLTSYLEQLKSLGLFGLNVPQLQGGKGYFFSESLWIAEHENVSLPLGVLLSSHRSVVDVISQCGTDLQKEKYLEKLASGSVVASEAVYEMGPSNDNLFNTKITYDVDQNLWILNGEKSFVVNGASSDLFLVMAQANPMSLEHEEQVTCAILLVDANTPGVKKEIYENKLGDIGVQRGCKLSFKNVKLDETNIVGGKMQNHKVGEVFMRSSRLRSSLVQLELSKKIINHLINYCIQTKECGTYLK